MAPSFRPGGGGAVIRRLVWSAVAVAGVLTLLGSWLLLNYERVPVDGREPPRAEARRNPYLALERFVARMGGRVERQSDARLLDRLPPGGTVFLERNRRHLLPPERLRHLRAWVEAGGHLIAVAELPGVADPLLDGLGIVRPDKPPALPKGPRGALAVRLPEGGRPLAADAGWHVLRPGPRLPDWSAEDGSRGAQMLHYRLGRGHLTVATHLDRQLHNRRIGARDHAELLWALVSAYDPSPSPRLLVVSRLEMPGLFDWLAENAAAACLALGTLLVLALWRTVPRFGAPRPDAPPARRELREHLAAIGRYLWRSGHLAGLVQPARDHFRARLALRRPAIAALPPDAQPAALAELARRPVARVAAALGGPADTPHAFTDALRTLRDLERQL